MEYKKYSKMRLNESLAIWHHLVSLGWAFDREILGFGESIDMQALTSEFTASPWTWAASILPGPLWLSFLQIQRRHGSSARSRQCTCCQQDAASPKHPDGCISHRQQPSSNGKQCRVQHWIAARLNLYTL